MKNFAFSIIFIKIIVILIFIIFVSTCPLMALDGELTYDDSPVQMILGYNIAGNELAGQDTVPRVRIYGDGRVLVHYPKYMKKAGDYSLMLVDTEMKKIIKHISDYGFVTIKYKDIKKLKKAKDEKSRQTSGKSASLYIAMDQDTIQFYYNLKKNNTSKIAGKADESIINQIYYPGLKQDRTKYPDIKEIQGLGLLHDWFQDLLIQPGLKKKKPFE